MGQGILENNNEKDDEDKSAGTDVHICLHCVAHPLRGCVSTLINVFEQRRESSSVLQRTQPTPQIVGPRAARAAPGRTRQPRMKGVRFDTLPRIGEYLD